MTPDELRVIRTELGLTINALAQKLHVHVTTISRYGRGLRKIPEPTALYILSLRPEGVRTPPKTELPVVLNRDMG